MVDIISKRPEGEPALIEGETAPPPPHNSFVAPVPPANPRKDGEYYDTCPADGCLEVDRIHKMGGQMGDGSGAKGEEYLDWSMFSADRRLGGCGTLWTRTTRQGVEMHKERNMGDPKWVTRSAQRTLSLPSQKYMDNYERIFGHS